MEGCLSASFQKVGGIQVNVQKTDECCSNIEFEKVSGIYNLEINKTSSSITNVDINRKHSKINISCGLICEVSIGEDGEPMWWCNEWRVLWNNGIATLWRK